MRGRQRTGEDGRDLTGAIDGDIDRQMRWRQRNGGAHEVVHGVAVPCDEGGAGIGNPARVVCLQNRRGGRQPRAHRFRASTEAGEEMGLHEAGDDAQVGLDVLALQPHRRSVDLTHCDVRVVTRAVMVDDDVARHDPGTEELLHFRRGRPPVRPGGAQERDAVVGHPAARQLGQERRQHRAVGHRARQIGEDDDHPFRAVGQVLQRSPEHGAAEGRQNRGRLVVEARLLHRCDDLGVVGDLDRRPVAAVGQLDAHGQGAGGPVPGSGPVAANTASATWSTRGRRVR